MDALTQRITEADLRAERIRVPHDAKHLFPAGRALRDLVQPNEVPTISGDSSGHLALE